MACNNCGLQKPVALVPVNRFREEGGGEHTEYWCLECIQGKKPIREQFDVPTEWRT
jgi:hypothetical protein